MSDVEIFKRNTIALTPEEQHDIKTMFKNIDAMTQEEIAYQLSWSDKEEFSYYYALWLERELDNLQSRYNNLNRDYEEIKAREQEQEEELYKIWNV